MTTVKFNEKSHPKLKYRTFAEVPIRTFFMYGGKLYMKVSNTTLVSGIGYNAITVCNSTNDNHYSWFDLNTEILFWFEGHTFRVLDSVEITEL
jgi:hypothetical protein